VIVAINRFEADTLAEMAAVRDALKDLDVKVVVSNHWAEGGAGAENLAHDVVELIESTESQFQPLYSTELKLWDKAKTIATSLYGAEDIIADQKVRDKFAQLQAEGYGDLPVCIAKTQYSFSTDPALKGAPSGHVLPIREVRLSAGAGFVVIVCGNIMTMPGLPREPAANRIRINTAGDVEGLF